MHITQLVPLDLNKQLKYSTRSKKKSIPDLHTLGAQFRTALAPLNNFILHAERLSVQSLVLVDATVQASSEEEGKKKKKKTGNENHNTDRLFS